MNSTARVNKTDESLNSDIDDLSFDEKYNEVLSISSSIKQNAEMLFAVHSGLGVLFKELCDEYGVDKITGQLKEFLSEKNEQDNNLLEFVRFIEPEKNQRVRLYERLNELSGMAEGSKNEDHLDGFYSIGNYELMLQGAISEGKSLDTLLGKISNFKNLFDFKFNEQTLDNFGFYEKLQEQDGDVKSTMEELRDIFVNSRQNKLSERISFLLEELDTRIQDLESSINEADSNFLNSVNTVRKNFYDSFTINNLDEVDKLTQSGIDALKESITTLQQSVNTLKGRIEQERKGAEEKRNTLLRVMNSYH